MPMVIVGVLLLVAKMAEFGPIANWSWWIILAPFLAAVLWWQFSDSTGLTTKRAMDKMEQRKADRRDRAMLNLGLDQRRERQISRARHDAARLAASADPTQRDNSGSSHSGSGSLPPPAMPPLQPPAPPAAPGAPGGAPRKDPRL